MSRRGSTARILARGGGGYKRGRLLALPRRGGFELTADVRRAYAPAVMPPAVWTSESHPLRVYWIEAPEGHSIGITIAPGKKGVSRKGHVWDRDVARDLDKLRSTDGIEVLVCLLETEEMTRLGNPDLLVTARARGIDALHFAIEDVTAPSKELAREAVAAVVSRRGRKIVIHCNGGLGRSGAIAGCVLRALGVSAEETLARLRKARGPECPQTDDQRRFVEAFVLESAPESS